MYVVAVTVFVKPDRVQPFIQATLDNARATRKEAGNVRFDVLQAEDDPARFLLYEAYRSKDGLHRPPADRPLPLLEADGGRLDGPAATGHQHQSLFFGDGQ